MDSYIIPEAVPQWDGLLASCEQDFPYGAKSRYDAPKTSFTGTPPSSTFANCDVPEWMETQTSLQWNNLEAFTDVLLPTDENFGPDDLFRDLPDTQEEQPLSNQFAFLKPNVREEKKRLDPFSVMPTQPKPKITIKLRRIKKNKRQTTCDVEQPTLSQSLSSPQYDLGLKSGENTTYFSSPNNFFDTLIEPSSPPKAEILLQDPNDESWLQSPNSEPICINFPVSAADMTIHLPEEFDHPNSPKLPEEQLSNMTLGDLVNSEHADNMLDQFLDVSSSSPKGEIGSLNLSVSPWSSPSASSCSESLSDVATSSSKSRKTKRVREPRRCRSPETRYNRKKEQNKEAALRYRLKKRKEGGDLSNILEIEEEHNKELKENYSNLKKELLFMKKLMREAFLIKGLVTPEQLQQRKKS